MTNQALNLYAGYLDAIHSKWIPHTGQINVGRALFNDGIRRIFVQCGRKWGKSEIAIYILLRWALVNQDAACYYFGPYQKQAKEILWLRLLKFIPPELIKEDGINKTESRVTLITGSFIKIDGSDNYEAYRGITPDLVVYDEFKDFAPEFHIAMEPNLAPRNAPLIILGTPPDQDCQYTELANEFKLSNDSIHFISPTHDNPHIPRKWLDDMEKRLRDRGEPDVWEREYRARFVKGGANSVFPMFSRERHVYEHEELVQEIARDAHKFEWYTVTDPGTASCFATLFVALHPYDKRIYIFDEIYERDSKQTSTGRIWPRINALELELCPRSVQYDTIYRGYDEAAAWFANEVLDRYGISFTPTAKAHNKKEEGLSLIKDQLLGRSDGSNVVKISTRCKWLIWEIENYIKDSKTGKIPKKNDHLIDCWRYFNGASAYDPMYVKEPPPPPDREKRRGYTMEQDQMDDVGDDDALN